MNNPFQEKQLEVMRALIEMFSACHCTKHIKIVHEGYELIFKKREPIEDKMATCEDSHFISKK